MIKLLDKFGLIVKHLKTEVFHFNKSHGLFDLPPLDLFSIEGPILVPKNSWKYLGFIFNRKLFFHQHIDFYCNRAISTVKCMKTLGDSSCNIILIQKYLLYRCCILSIALYGFQLWFYNCTPLSYPLKILNKIQRRAAIWILGAFKTSLSRSLMVDFILFSLFTLFFFFFSFSFSIFRTTWVRVYQSCCHISHKTDHGTWENGVEGSGTK